MTYGDAIVLINRIQEERGEGLLETLTYMDTNFIEFDVYERAAFYLVMDGFRELFKPV